MAASEALIYIFTICLAVRGVSAVIVAPSMDVQWTSADEAGTPRISLPPRPPVHQSKNPRQSI